MSEHLSGETWLTSESKRRRDIAWASTLIVPALGLSAMSAAALFLEHPAKPIFKQRRVGQNGSTFGLYKLRTMLSPDYNDIGDGDSDIRATRLGRILRKPGLDELPQFLNVLQGSMSVVGPRPLLLEAVEQMHDVLSDSEYEEWLRAYTTPRPGIVSKFSNVSRSLSPQSDLYLTTRAELDVDYFETATKALDDRIVVESITLASHRFINPGSNAAI